MKTSFGQYFDDQRDRMIEAMQNKNAQLWKEWLEDFDERQKIKQAKIVMEDINQTKLLIDDINQEEEEEYPYAWYFKVC